MNSINEQKELLKQIMDMLEQHFGTHTEFVLHDSSDYSKTIVDIRNGHITGRAVGGCGSEMGLEILRGTQSIDNCLKANYVTYTRDGKILRSSSLYFKNDQGEMIGSLCINTDITETVQFEAFLREYNNYNPNYQPVNEIFVPTIQQLLEELINRAFQLAGKKPEDMTRDDKIEFIKFLDSKGAFFISKSAERVWDILGISKFTFYNYLEASRTGAETQIDEQT